MDEHPFRVGLTGGIASGKSTVAKIFAGHGIPIIDTDVIAREVVEPGQPALKEIAEAFGEGVIKPDGSLDRAALRDLIFGVESARKTLEGILHPIIREETVRQANAAGGDYQLVVVPLLTSSPLRLFVDRVLVIDCEEAEQIRRLTERDGESEEQANRILAAQASRDERLAIADDMILNDADLDTLREKVDKMHAEYLLAARRHAQGF